MRARQRRHADFAAVARATCLALTCIGIVSCSNRRDPLHRVVDEIRSKSTPDSTSVVVLSDAESYRYLKSSLPSHYNVILSKYSELPQRLPHTANGLLEQFRLMRLTSNRPEFWLIGGIPSSARMTVYADLVAWQYRICVHRDTVGTARGDVVVARWVSEPNGAGHRAQMAWRYAMAESIATAPPLQDPFSEEDLRIDRDSLNYYLGKLADESYYEIGGCDEVEIPVWTASEKLAQMGPGVVPALVRRIDDPDPFVRERAHEALSLVTQDQRIMTRTGGDYVSPEPSAEPVSPWWRKYRHFWQRTRTRR